ncbi:hypothetical protein ACZ11_12990 [Lysinibacillus xylanilyticus]|uniref:Uncharacterized protein n=1 Tax=Lysinibacillus xylanilyticus TaxID=582475 RepID=A0A0K9FFI7_9BACI|nr:hypothetical protein ACZ11_12990 [Lysinibacillus xylanilyticus]
MAYGITGSISFFYKMLRILKVFRGYFLIFIVYHLYIESDEVSEEDKEESFHCNFKVDAT